MNILHSGDSLQVLLQMLPGRQPLVASGLVRGIPGLTRVHELSAP